MKVSTYHSYDDLPLFLNAELISKVLGVSLASAYELMHDKEFPAGHVGSRIVVAKEQFQKWVAEQMGGDKL